MGKASKAVLVIFRIWQVICSAIVLGILARFLHLLSEAGATRDGRIIYGIIVASISIVFAIVFIAPFMYAFLAFPFDFVLFVMWLVLFCLLITVSPRSLQYLIQLTLGAAHRLRDMQFTLVLELLGLLLGRMVEETCFYQRTSGYCLLRMQPLEGRSGIRFSGPDWVPRHGNFGKSDYSAYQERLSNLYACHQGAYVVSKYWKKKKSDRHAGTTPYVPFCPHPSGYFLYLTLHVSSVARSATHKRQRSAAQRPLGRLDIQEAWLEMRLEQPLPQPQPDRLALMSEPMIWRPEKHRGPRSNDCRSCGRWDLICCGVVQSALL